MIVEHPAEESCFHWLFRLVELNQLNNVKRVLLSKGVYAHLYHGMERLSYAFQPLRTISGFPPSWENASVYLQKEQDTVFPDK